MHCPYILNAQHRELWLLGVTEAMIWPRPRCPVEDGTLAWEAYMRGWNWQKARKDAD